MAQTNIRAKRPVTKTHAGGPARTMTPIKRLEQVLFAHLLWEDSFYIDGEGSADVLQGAVLDAMRRDPARTVATILQARTSMNIRHAALHAAVIYAMNHGTGSRGLIAGVIQRADEMAEVLAMAGAKAAPHAVMKGVRDVFESGRFDEYQLGKWKGDGKGITLRDAVFLTHPNPEKAPLVQKVVDQTLDVPATWEVGLSAGGDKREVFEGLLKENRLGAMALLRNLRGMNAAGVDRGLIEAALARANWSRVLPFRFLSAAVYAPEFAKPLAAAFEQAVDGSVRLDGHTAVLVDTSGSMSTAISAKSVVSRVQTAAALGAAVRGGVDVFEWADRTRQVPNFGGLATALSIRCGGVGHGTQARQAVEFAQKANRYDRIVLISDMQFADAGLPALQAGQTGYTINVAPYGEAGIAHGAWTHFSGFSDAVLKFIAAHEAR